MTIDYSEDDRRRCAAELLKRRRRGKHKPQPGPQTMFVEGVNGDHADVTIFGGGAGGGKTRGMLLRVAKYIDNPKFRAVVFRRTYPEIEKSGALWDKTLEVFRDFDGEPTRSAHVWRFPSGAEVSLSHMKDETDADSWQGTDIDVCVFEELTHFTAYQWWYLMSRLRSGHGFRTQMIGTCNPQSRGFVRDMVDWYIGKDGLPIKERSGALRWFARASNDVVHWGDTREEAMAKAGTSSARSFRFIQSLLADNRELEQSDPTYRESLESLPRKQREELLKGNWSVTTEAGDYFKTEWFAVQPRMAVDAIACVWAWDLAGTEPNGGNDPDWTVGVCLALSRDGRLFVEHIERMRKRSHDVDEAIRRCAEITGPRVRIYIEQEPGSSGKARVESIQAKLSGYFVEGVPSTGSKEDRAQDPSGDVDKRHRQGLPVVVFEGVLTEEFIATLNSFPKKSVHDDDVDAFTLGHAKLMDFARAVSRFHALAS